MTKIVKKTQFVILLVILVLVSCKDRDPEPSVFLTIPAHFNPGFNGGDQWVYATDKNGKLLAIQQTSPGAAVELKSTDPIPDSITVTFFTATPAGDGQDHFLLWSFGGIPRNSSLTTPVENQFIPQLEVVGAATITVSDYPGITRPGPITFSDGWSTFRGQPNFNENYYKALINLNSGHPDILVCAYDGETPKYAWFNGVNPGDSLVKSFTEFNTFTNTLSLGWEGSVYATIAGYNDNTFFGNGYISSNLDIYAGTQPNDVPVGYIDGFPGYRTKVTSISEDIYHGIVYQKTGSINATIPFPSFDFTFSNKSLKDFAFVTATPYDFKNSFWTHWYSDWTASWWIYSDNLTTPRFTEIPPVLLAKYPKLDITKLEHQNTNLHKSLAGYSYSDFIHEWLAGYSVTVGYSMSDAEYYEYSAVN